MTEKILELPNKITYGQWVKITKTILDDKENTYRFPNHTIKIIPDPKIAEFI